MALTKKNETIPVGRNPEHPMPEVTIRPVEISKETEPTSRETEVRHNEQLVEASIATPQQRHQPRRHTRIPQVRDELIVRIEKIMEEGLHDAYREMTAIQKQRFKIEGEKAAHKIQQMVKSGRVKAKKVFEIILAWLKLLPGVNRFFLEQEAKIKTDKILALQPLRYR